MVNKTSRLVSTLVVAWLLPGCGHFSLGRRQLGVAFFAIIMACLGVGVWLKGPMPWAFAGAPLEMLSTYGSLGSGLLYLVLRGKLGIVGDVLAPGYDYGGWFIMASVLWGWAVDGQRPERVDVLGVLLCIAGASLIFLGPRST